MASPNLDLVRSIYTDWERGDYSSIEWAHPDVEFETFGFDASRTRGVAAMGKRWRDWMSAWGDYRSEPDEFRELDGERVLVLMQHSGRGKASGVGIENMTRPGANVFEIRDGKVVRLALYWDRQHALADLGLKE
jgi:ketosteroid isomerase-like protein